MTSAVFCIIIIFFFVVLDNSFCVFVITFWRRLTRTKKLHASYAVLQPHLDVLHGFKLEHEHLIKFKIFSGANSTFARTVVGCNDLDFSSRIQPYLPGSSFGWSSSKAHFQMHACMCARFILSVNASVVGGKRAQFWFIGYTGFSSSNCPHLNSCFWHGVAMRLTITRCYELRSLFHYIRERRINVSKVNQDSSQFSTLWALFLYQSQNKWQPCHNQSKRGLLVILVLCFYAW